MVIPKNQFAANPTNGIIINQNGLSQIEQIQNDYQNELNFKTLLYYVLTVLMFFTCLIPFLIYYRFVREPKIDYRAEYERDIPTDDPSAVVNAICGPGFSKKIGEPDMDGFKATIMDLIDGKYLLFNKQDHHVNDEVLKKIFNKKGDNYLKIFGLGAITVAVVVFFFTLSDPLPAASWAFVASIILGIVALLSFIMPQRVAGQWTTYGEEYDANWHNFKKYIRDFSLIREYQLNQWLYGINIWFTLQRWVLQMLYEKQWNNIFLKTS